MAARSEIVLIGPSGAGKSTLAKRLGRRLEVPVVSLDVLKRTYYPEAGYAPETASRCFAEHGFFGLYEYRKPFEARAVVRALAEHRNCIFDFGAGHSVFEDPDQLRGVAKALAPFENVVLVLPSADLDSSIATLLRRTGGLFSGGREFTEWMTSHPSLQQLARERLYTNGKSIEECVDEVLIRAGRRLRKRRVDLEPLPKPVEVDRSSLAQIIHHADLVHGAEVMCLRRACEIHYALRGRDAARIEGAEPAVVQAWSAELSSLSVPPLTTGDALDAGDALRARRLYEAHAGWTPSSLPELLSADPAFNVFPLALSGFDEDAAGSGLALGYFRRPQRSRFLALHAACAAWLAKEALGAETRVIATRARIAEALANRLGRSPADLMALHCASTYGIASRLGPAAIELLDVMTLVEVSLAALLAGGGASEAIVDVLLEGVVLPLVNRPLTPSYANAISVVEALANSADTPSLIAEIGTLRERLS